MCVNTNTNTWAVWWWNINDGTTTTITVTTRSNQPQMLQLKAILYNTTACRSSKNSIAKKDTHRNSFDCICAQFTRIVRVKLFLCVLSSYIFFFIDFRLWACFKFNDALFFWCISFDCCWSFLICECRGSKWARVSLCVFVCLYVGTIWHFNDTETCR